MAREGGRAVARARPQHRHRTAVERGARRPSARRGPRAAGSCSREQRPQTGRTACGAALDGRALPAARRRRAGVRRQHRRGPGLAGERLHAGDDRVRRAARDAALPRAGPAAARHRHRRPRAERRAARAGRQGARRRPVHRRAAGRPEPAAHGADGDRPEAGDRAAAVHAFAGRGLPAPARVRPLPDARARPAARADPRQGAGREPGRESGPGRARRVHRRGSTAACRRSWRRPPPRTHDPGSALDAAAARRRCRTRSIA